jgi:acyl-CoA synthetase (AMP-forming)/AMP-acid ligase II
LLLNTSGTTGLSKAALISHRAQIARMTTFRMDLKFDPEDAFLAWSPMNHIGGTEHTISSLMMGSTVIITDGLDIDAICSVIGRYKIGWLLLMPATIEPLLKRLAETKTRVVGVKVVGCMADLVPAAQIAEVTTALNAFFVNSFGSTETGLPPATGHLIPVGEVPIDLSKKISSLCEFRLVDEDDNDVHQGEVGEALLRGPTLFSGYWNAPEVNAAVFRDGWFRMGDLLRQTKSGGFEFVGRLKYLIKTGGENVYPAEIERVLLSDNRVEEAAVVRKMDSHWGEIIVAFISRNTETLTNAEIEKMCRAKLASYKRPREIYFIPIDEFPRNDSGKIIRESLERRLEQV